MYIGDREENEAFSRSQGHSQSQQNPTKVKGGVQIISIQENM